MLEAELSTDTENDATEQEVRVLQSIQTPFFVVQLFKIGWTFQRQSLEKSIIECCEKANAVSLLDNQLPLPPNDSSPLQGNRSPMLEKPKANSSLNPFIDVDDLPANGVEENPPLPSIETLIVNQPTVASVVNRPLPPIPPRQRSYKSTDAIRIPINLVRSNQTESNGKNQTPSVDSNNASSPIVQSKPLAETTNATPTQNGNGYFNGDDHPIEPNNHEPSYPSRCPCKSGAHPKHGNNNDDCQVNGNSYGRATPARILGKFIDWSMFQWRVDVIFISFAFVLQNVCDCHRKVMRFRSCQHISFRRITSMSS